MAVSLRGDLRDFGLADVFQLIGQQRKTGVLEFTGEREQIRFLFDRGSVVSAAPVGSWSHAALGEMLLRCGLLTRERLEELRRECEASLQTLPAVAISRGWLAGDELRQIEDLLTRETIFAVLRWSEGSFDFIPREIDHDRHIDSLLGAEQILMDGLRMVDEWQSFADLVPSETTVFQRAGSFEEYAGRLQGEERRHLPNAERVYALIDGRLNVRRVIDLSLLGTFDAVRALASMHRLRTILPAAPSRAAPAAEVRRPGASRLRRGLTALACLGLLAAVSGFSLQRTPSEPADPFRVVRPDPLGAARDAFAKRAVRRGLEVHWWREGRWPAELAELAPGRGALAAAEGAPYYYVVREDGIRLLAPRR